MGEKNCGKCKFSEGIDGTNRIGCNIDKHQHDIDHKCLNYELAAEDMLEKSLREKHKEESRRISGKGQ